MAERVVSSSKKIDDGICNDMHVIVGQLLDQFFGWFAQVFREGDHLPDYLLSIFWGYPRWTRAKESLGAWGWLEEREVEKALAGEQPGAGHPTFRAETDGEHLSFRKFRFIVGFTIRFSTMNERKLSLNIRWWQG